MAGQSASQGRVLRCWKRFFAFNSSQPQRWGHPAKDASIGSQGMSCQQITSCSRPSWRWRYKCDGSRFRISDESRIWCRTERDGTTRSKVLVIEKWRTFWYWPELLFYFAYSEASGVDYLNVWLSVSLPWGNPHSLDSLFITVSISECIWSMGYLQETTMVCFKT